MSAPRCPYVRALRPDHVHDCKTKLAGAGVIAPRPRMVAAGCGTWAEDAGTPERTACSPQAGEHAVRDLRWNPGGSGGEDRQGSVTKRIEYRESAAMEVHVHQCG